MELDSVTRLFTLRFHGVCEVDNDVGQSVIELGSTSSCRAYTAVYMCVTAWINYSLYIIVHSTFCVQVKFALIVPMLQ